MKQTMKVCICLITAILGTLAVSKTVRAYDFSYDKSIYKVHKKFVYTTTDMPKGCAKVIGYKGNKKKVSIPAKIKGKKVTVVTRFEKAKKIKTMHLPATVKQVSLTMAPNLTKVTISEKNKYFKVKDNLILNKEETKVCSSFGKIEKVIIPDSVSEIEASAFWYSSITEVMLGEKVKKIGYNAFGDCHNLKKVTLNANLETIRENAFAFCENLSEIRVNNTNKAPIIETEALSSQNEGIDFYVKNKIIAEHIKENLNNIDVDKIRIHIGNELYFTNIFEEDGIFYQLTGGEVIVCGIKREEKVLKLPEKLGGYTVVSIGEKALSKAKCEEIYLPNSVTNIQYAAFEDNTVVKKIVLGAGVKKIKSWAFCRCTALEEMVLPNSVTKLENAAFESCTALKKIVLSENITQLSGGVFSGCSALKKIVIPRNIKRIKTHAFLDCKSLVSVQIENNDLKLGDGAFEGCSSLKKINLPANLKVISIDAFSRCSSLKKIEIPASVQRIYKGAFYGCKKLKKIKFSKNVVEISSDAFMGCYALKKYEIDKKNKKYSVKKGILYNKDKTKLISYPAGKRAKVFQCDSSVKKIGDGAFSYNKFIRKVVLNGQKVGGFAFSNMKELRTFIWNGDADFVPSELLAHCDKIKKVVLPDKIKQIWSDEFYQK